MPHIFFTDEEHQLMIDRAILRGNRRLDSEIESMVGLADRDVDEIRLLWFKQLRPYAATYLALAATARIVSKDFGGDHDGEQAFIERAMDHVFELTRSIEIPDSIAAKTDPDRLDDAIFNARQEVRECLEESLRAPA
jgi:hypothetical protein